MFEGVQDDEVQNAAAQHEGHEFGDVNGNIPKPRDRGKDRFERHNRNERDHHLRRESAARRAQHGHTRGLMFRHLIFCKEDFPL